MVQNRKAQIIYRSIYLVIAFVGILASFGVFDGKYNNYWYLFFTNISNYLCFFTVLALLCYTVRDYKNGEKRGLSAQAPLFRFCVCVMILITFFVYNTLLSNPFSGDYWMNWQSLILHVVCPIMFVVDYLIFSKHRSINVFAPLFSCIMPFIYVLIILSRGEVVLGSGALAYPYYFLNAHAIGYGRVALFVFVFLIVFVALGYAIWAFDKLVRDENGKLKWDMSPLPKPEPVVEETEDVKVDEENQAQQVNEDDLKVEDKE